MTYNEAVSWIHNRLRLGIKPGLQRMKWMMERLGHPHKKMKAIHVGGTNGKGSTVCFVRNILEQHSYQVGTFTSPYLISFNERISVNGEPITDNEITELVQIIKPLAEQLETTELGAPTEFEVITAMAFYYFGELRKVDFVIFEVGLGGRLDSTNIVEPLVSVITSIGFDHMAILGDSLEQIAFEKAGIIKKGTPVVVGVDQEEALTVIKKQAIPSQADILVLNTEAIINDHEVKASGELFTLTTPLKKYKQLDISMNGFHQVRNASIAVMAVEQLHNQGALTIDDVSLRNGLHKANWQGRYEILQSSPPIIIDGAHNPEGVASLLATLEAHIPHKRWHFIIAVLNDKKLENMLNSISSKASSVSCTTFNFPRACQAEELAELIHHDNKQIFDDWRHAIDENIRQLSEEDALIITGSLYFLSDVRKYVLESL
ncbi:bifunctional folylpolyglutamate synthase/dihydrofolate synthase [Bacillus sp. HMF5848]|nr:bifunctional folylpolyglutamate synthase/dihydrofolate synthase [Bacillus sp. HMF5848]